MSWPAKAGHPVFDALRYRAGRKTARSVGYWIARLRGDGFGCIRSEHNPNRGAGGAYVTGRLPHSNLCWGGVFEMRFFCVVGENSEQKCSPLEARQTST